MAPCPNECTVLIHHTQTDGVNSLDRSKILNASRQVQAIHVGGVVHHGMEEVTAVKFGGFGVIEPSEQVGDVETDGKAFADFEGVAPVQLQQAATSFVVVCDRHVVGQHFAVGNVVAEIAEGQDTCGCAPMPGHRQA